MIMLHAVVHGFGRRKHAPYKNIIARSMMKFQGKQTVNNMIVVTLLIASACFGIFYVPILSIGTIMEYHAQPYDYFYHYRADQTLPDRAAIETLAEEYGLSLKDWGEFDYITLAFGAFSSIMEEDGKHWHDEYIPICIEKRVISEDTWNTLTGENIDVLPGTYLCITNQEETALSIISSAKHITNMVTRTQISTQYAGLLHYDLMTDMRGYCVLDNTDYALLSEGLTDDWKGRIVSFNVDGKDSYPFADALFHRMVSCFDENCFTAVYHDRITTIRAEEQGIADWQASDPMMRIDPAEADSLTFRQNWEYIPRFRILSMNDFLLSTSVFLMMFLFIFIVCILTVLIICYTRCQTIALNNRYIFDDLKKLGASPNFLDREVRSQCGSVFRVPAVVALIAVYLFFILLLYGNDGQLVYSEIVSLGACLGIEAALSILIYGVYRVTVAGIRQKLGIFLQVTEIE